MDYQKIDALLEKYWQGETTVAEEAQLRQFFSEEDPPARLRPVAALFQYYETPPQLDEAFDERVLSQLHKQNRASMWPNMLKVAAVVVLFLLGGFWWSQTYDDSPDPVVAVAAPSDTYEDPEQAYREAKQALLLVSTLMNEGTQHLTKLEEFDEAQQTVKEQPAEL